MWDPCLVISHNMVQKFVSVISSEKFKAASILFFLCSSLELQQFHEQQLQFHEEGPLQFQEEGSLQFQEK